MAELVAFCAWQYGGVRMMHSWGAEAYKRDGRVVLEALPVRLAYAGVAQADAPRPARPEPPLPTPEEVMRRATARGAPPSAWLEFLAANPIVLGRWSALYEAVIEDGVLERRIKQLLRVQMAEQIGCPGWAPEGSAALAAAGVGRREREAIAASGFASFTARERAALRYGQALALGSEVPEDTFAEVAAQFSAPEIVELGYAVAVQNGAVRAFRGLTAARAPWAAERVDAGFLKA